MLTNALVVVVAWILSIMAIKHIAYILIYGSIFESLRRTLREKSGAGVKGWIFKKINGMFTCNLCMVTQLALWMFTLPLLCLVYNRFEEVGIFLNITLKEPLSGVELFILINASLIVWMSTASLSVLYWNLSEFRIERFEKQRAYYERLLSEAVADGGYPIILNQNTARMLLRYIDDNCSYIDCSYSRRNCTFHRMREWAEEIRKKQGISVPIYLPTEVMELVSKMYFRSNTNEKEVAKLLKKIY